jgi:ribose/xylose/arabinose/galactoside ABC-type transport system permease subunit
MAYDESTFRRQDTASTDPVGVGRVDDSRFRGEPGFRDEPDFRATGSAYAAGGLPAGDFKEAKASETTMSNGLRRVHPAVLDDVFDDPEHGDPGRDRMAVHAVWEIVLLLAVGVVGFLLYRADGAAVRGERLDSLLVFAAALGALTLAAGLSLRAGAPNLAIGPVAVASSLHFAENGDKGVLEATSVAVAIAAVAGIVLAVLVVGFHVPGWAASFGAALAVVVYITQRSAPVNVQGEYDPTRHAFYLFGGFAAIAVLGGLLGTIKPVRRAIGRFRPVGDPARRRGGIAATLTSLSLVLSMIFAVVAGVLFAAGVSRVVPGTGFELTGLALGAALVGGTSAFGRRGGVFGSVFAVALLALFIRYADVKEWKISHFAIAAAAVGVGLVVTRLVEALGRPLSARDEDEDWESDTETTWSGSRQESWSSALPAQPTTARTDPWDNTDRWAR